jgi:hypothetical protein
MIPHLKQALALRKTALLKTLAFFTCAAESKSCQFRVKKVNTIHFGVENLKLYSISSSFNMADVIWLMRMETM